MSILQKWAGWCRNPTLDIIQLQEFVGYDIKDQRWFKWVLSINTPKIYYEIMWYLMAGFCPRNSSTSLRGQWMWSNSVDVSCSFPVSMVPSTESRQVGLFSIQRTLSKTSTLDSKTISSNCPLEMRLRLCRQLRVLTWSLAIFEVFHTCPNSRTTFSAFWWIQKLAASQTNI